MTFRQRLEREHPDGLGEQYVGGCCGCPSDFGYEKKMGCLTIVGDKIMKCEECWGREMPEPLSDAPQAQYRDKNASDDKMLVDDEKCLKNDPVNHPKHYTGKYECIDVMIELFGVEAVKNFCACNAFKYIWRFREKNGIEDVKKADWYLNKLIEMEECDLMSCRQEK